ncbi:nucleotidyltransferase family protein [Anaerosporobacter faecicola]|uniref:hypothetical protein n=1 Tax=Anaerosporobacter faecicola TaxID=2718714 RepID=UPI00143AB938|nr:hypothetical protein [Anaerosporobacter faecicola]
MEEIRSHIDQAKQVSDYYEKNIKDYLEKIDLVILDKIKTALDGNAKKYDLVLENSVYENIYLYEFSSRVKKPESLKEKLIRKEEIFQYKTLLEGTNVYEEIPKELEEHAVLEQFKKNNLCNKICGVDDLIGIKILTSLKVDCKKVFTLLKEKLNNSDIVSLEFDDNPTIMKNGREIYKLKGVYKDYIKFELQIKSKIDSAWGELEHNLFYKDYDYDFVKDTNKSIMNNIGEVLDKIEDTLLTIRNNKKEFNENYQKASFMNSIDKLYREKIIDIFSSNYLLEDNLDLLYYIYSKTAGLDASLKLVSENGIKAVEEITAFIPNTDLIKNYLQLKENNFRLRLIELIYFNWMNTLESQLSVEDMVKELIENIIYYKLDKYSQICNKVILANDVVTYIINLLKSKSLSLQDNNFLINSELLYCYIEAERAHNEQLGSIMDGNVENYTEINEESIEEIGNRLKECLFRLVVCDEIIEIEIDPDDIKVYISNMKETLKTYNHPNNKSQYNDILRIVESRLGKWSEKINE